MEEYIFFDCQLLMHKHRHVIVVSSRGPHHLALRDLYEMLAIFDVDAWTVLFDTSKYLLLNFEFCFCVRRYPDIFECTLRVVLVINLANHSHSGRTRNKATHAEGAETLDRPIGVLA